jgi:hypothetical protein
VQMTSGLKTHYSFIASFCVQGDEGLSYRKGENRFKSLVELTYEVLNSLCMH